MKPTRPALLWRWWIVPVLCAACDSAPLADGGAPLDEPRQEVDAARAAAEPASEPAPSPVTVPDAQTPAPAFDAGLRLPDSLAPAPALDAKVASGASDAGAPREASAVAPADAATDARLAPSDAGFSRSILVRGIPEAENLFFTDAGRLFVSGGENVFEIRRAAQGALEKVDLFHEECLVEGIAESRGYLYGVCSRTGLSDLLEAYLFAGALGPTPELRIIAKLEDGVIPNGLAADDQGRLYVTCSGAGEILRITLASPLEVARREVWVQGLTFVNGLKIGVGAVYFTSLADDLSTGRFGRIPIADGGAAAAPEFLFERSLTVLDDLLPHEGGFVLTDYLTGSLIFWRDGKVYDETPAGTFFSPTALARGQPPLFSSEELLVTEKGVIFVEDAPDEGDLLSSLRRN